MTCILTFLEILYDKLSNEKKINSTEKPEASPRQFPTKFSIQMDRTITNDTNKAFAIPRKSKIINSEKKRNNASKPQIPPRPTIDSHFMQVQVNRKEKKKITAGKFQEQPISKTNSNVIEAIVEDSRSVNLGKAKPGEKPINTKQIIPKGNEEVAIQIGNPNLINDNKQEADPTTSKLLESKKSSVKKDKPVEPAGKLNSEKMNVISEDASKPNNKSTLKSKINQPSVDLHLVPEKVNQGNNKEPFSKINFNLIESIEEDLEEDSTPHLGQGQQPLVNQNIGKRISKKENKEAAIPVIADDVTIRRSSRMNVTSFIRNAMVLFSHLTNHSKIKFKLIISYHKV